VDLGTVSTPGDNLFQDNMVVGVNVTSNLQVSAVGNTWNANVQDAAPDGRYTTVATIPGPLAGAIMEI
jgi:hypothetical protein